MSYKIGARKPEAAAFAAAAAALSLPPSACAFVDDLGAYLNDDVAFMTRKQAHDIFCP